MHLHVRDLRLDAGARQLFRADGAAHITAPVTDGDDVRVGQAALTFRALVTNDGGDRRDRTFLVALAPGFRLGPYEILSLVGSGGMGEVYRAKDTKLGRDVAVKILPATFTNDPERLARFRR